MPVTIGRIVHYVMPSGKVRPAMVVQTWSAGMVNVQVFTDGVNDLEAKDSRAIVGTMWKSSVEYSEDPKPNTWHWPPRVA